MNRKLIVCFTLQFLISAISILQINALSKTVFKNQLFCQKAQNFVYFGPYDFVHILPACGAITYQIMYGENFRLPMSAFAIEARKNFNGKFTAKIDFPIGHYHY